MPLWYVMRDGECWAWTYAKSQKVRNLERDPRCTLQVEAGRAYQELRGVMLRCEAVLHSRRRRPSRGSAPRSPRATRAPGVDPRRRASGAPARPPSASRSQFAERDRVSWDHRKLGGTYWLAARLPATWSSSRD